MNGEPAKTRTLLIRHDEQHQGGLFRDIPLGLKALLAYSGGNRPRNVVYVTPEDNMDEYGYAKDPKGRLKKLALDESLPSQFEPVTIPVPAGLRPNSKTNGNVFCKNPSSVC